MFEIQFMTRKDVEREEAKKAIDMMENNWLHQFMHCGMPIMGFKFKTLLELNKAARMAGKEPNKYVMELLGGQNGGK